ncbi:hypothetical protein RAS12_08510 [Achromobacter seleniivolatilans]|uniref:Uncharacterized protein n=1 Tax=Achromobacter seleniivolatilans TaxID=3047478 RepID=A0ABY9M6H3_9BURK|nr:hypothetical protein [Achromobacter sp. R39]WMD22405.1 hypothetical protein RAS12_08510 [Achromobacter sp. R39]
MAPAPGHTDLESNALYVSDSPVQEYVEWALHGTLPLALFPTVLHEATHHWCMSGSVGRALAQLALEAQEDWAKAPYFPVFVDDFVQTQWDTVQQVNALLEPLLEGMAMFAQFDVYPGPSPVLSGAMEMIARLFAPQGSADPVDLVDALRRRLIDYRCSNDAWRQKSGMLARPLNCQNGGYFIGYLAVKSLWHRARKVSPRLRDGDLFLLYLRNLIFDDASFVERLLNTAATDDLSPQAADELVRHVNARLKLLAADDLDARVAEMEEALLQRNDLEDNWDCIYLDKPQVDGVNERLRQRLLSLLPTLKDVGSINTTNMTREARREAIFAYGQTFDPAALGFDEADPAQLQRMGRICGLLAHRPLVRLRVDAIDFKIDANGMCEIYVAGVHSVSIEALAGRPAGSCGSASLALYYLPEERELALICVDKEGTLFAHFGHSVPAERQTMLTAVMRSTILGQQRRDTLSEWLRMQADLEDEPPASRARFAARIESFYLDRALAFVGDDHLDACHHALRTNGLWQFLEEDGQNINAYACLGLVQSWTSNEDVARQMLLHQGMDIDKMIALFRRVQATRGLPLIHETAYTVFI